MRETAREMAPVEAEAATWFDEHWDPTRTLGDWWRDLADSGYAFPSWPVGFGGLGLDEQQARAVIRARRRAGAYGPPNGVATFLVAPTRRVAGAPHPHRR
jgi:alkylation response protein AidB-like acyl-CoA dehydrogenase